MTTPTKRCPRCGPKPLTEFGVRRAAPDLLQGYCRDCARRSSKVAAQAARRRRLAAEAKYRVALAEQVRLGVIVEGGGPS